MSTSDATAYDDIIRRYLRVVPFEREGVNGPGPNGGWPAERLVIRHPDTVSELATIAEGTSLRFTEIAVRNLLADMIDEAVLAERERCTVMGEPRK